MHVYLPEKCRSPFLHGVLLSQKFESLIVSFDGSFRSWLLESYLVILTLERTWYHHTSLSSAFLSQELPILPNSLLERESRSQLYQMFLIAPSLIMPASIQFGFGDEAIWRKVWLFTRSCFHEEFLEFQSYSEKSFWCWFKANSFWRNSSDSYGEVLTKMWNMKWHLVGHERLKYQFEGYWEPSFDENVKNTKWHLVGHKRLKFQFEGYWEPSSKHSFYVHE